MKRLMFLTLFCTIIPLIFSAVLAQEVKQAKTGVISGQLMIKDDEDIDLERAEADAIDEKIDEDKLDKVKK